MLRDHFMYFFFLNSASLNKLHLRVADYNKLCGVILHLGALPAKTFV